MAYEFRGAGALDYFPCRYGTSRLQFRGPRRPLQGAYVAALGGNETYGRFVERPWPALTEGDIGTPVVNFGYMNAGIDMYLSDEAVLSACKGARAAVVQITGAQNLTNDYYSVHPRRNDRFVRASRALHDLYPGVDFTEFNFTRHMLTVLCQHAPDRFARVAQALKSVWVVRMRELVAALDCPVILLWVSQQRPPEPGAALVPGIDPLLVDRAMIEEVRAVATDVVELVPTAGALAEGTSGMIFDPLDAGAAAALPGPAVHSEVAAAVGPALREILDG